MMEEAIIKEREGMSQQLPAQWFKTSLTLRPKIEIKRIGHLIRSSRKMQMRHSFLERCQEIILNMMEVQLEMKIKARTRVSQIKYQPTLLSLPSMMTFHNMKISSKSEWLKFKLKILQS